MDILKRSYSLENTDVLLLWRRGEESSYLKNVDTTIYKDGIVQVRNSADKERITTHISNIVIVENGAY